MHSSLYKRWRSLGFAVLLSFTAVSLVQGQDVYKEFNTEVAGEYRYFFNSGNYPNQHQNYFSIKIEPELLLEWDDGRQQLNFTGFLRLDRDDRRTHADIRELYWLIARNNWELSVGLKKVFWGVTESIHLVDIINSTDIVESFDGEEKLGQPMVHFSYVSKIGTIDLFALPYTRRPQFPGSEGRLRTPFIIDGSEAGFESGSEEYRPTFATRWSNSIGVFDIGLSHFYGNGREPLFDVASESVFYPVNHQTGLDIQATTGPFLWKFEAIRRDNKFQEVYALAGGFEYTFSNIRDSGIDIGILGEYLYDNRDDLAISGMDNDLFVGSRIAFNDTQSSQILAGAIFDLSKSTQLWSIEAERRIGSSWKASVEMRLFEKVAREEFLLYALRQDSFAQFTISKFF
ncbi:hypothetical protein QQ008_10855 [Fulvivirgaceae bacterium BMA10]|uniref:Porin n=1 Tax=Splendidivirga corallicola TaxID=3051826 RepID=A0ABT8KN42_9BACT|nr:hypothetical protein [Fulvivirgaceae bacterium BMA10]